MGKRVVGCKTYERCPGTRGAAERKEKAPALQCSEEEKKKKDAGGPTPLPSLLDVELQVFPSFFMCFSRAAHTPSTVG